MKRLAILCLLLPLSGCFDYSDGNRVGTVVKFSRKGVFCKTWEGELLVGGLKRVTTSSTDGNGNLHSSSSMALNVMEFTVEDLSLVKPIQDAMESGKPVRVEYNQELMTFCRSDGNSSFVKSIKVLN